MKKLACFIISIILILSACVPAYAASGEYAIDISLDNNSISSDSPTKYGIDLSKIKSSNLVENGSFEDNDNGWIFSSSEYTYGKDNSIHKNNPTYNVVTVDGSYLLKNTCYGGASFIKGEGYEFSFFIKNIDFEGTISVWLDSDKNKNEITQLSTSGISKNGWTRSSATLTAVESEIGGLAIKFEGKGSIEIDFVSLVAENSYGYENDSWRGFGISQDIFNALQIAKPSFLAFSIDSTSWKNTIGSPYNRKGNELGYHEYLQLCYDLNAIAIPTLNANKFEANSNKFTNYKQDILDLIEYANASWETSYYGSLRAANGSQEAFNLKYIQLIGDGEQFGEIKKAIESKYKSITILSENDIKIIKNENRDMRGAIENAKNALKSGEFVMLDNFFGDVIKCSENEISYSTNYYAQMLLANNQGSKILDVNLSASDVEFESEATIDKAKNTIYISIANSGSATNSIIRADKIDGVTSASIQYISDGYLSSYNDIGKQYVAPEEKELEISDGNIEFKIPENSISVVRITFNNASSDALFSFPDTINLKAKNYVPPVLIAVIVGLAAAIPFGTVIGFVLYKKVISKKAKENENA